MGKIRWIMERDEKGTFRMKTVCGFLELNLFWEEEVGGWYNLYPIIDGKVLNWQATTYYWPSFDSDDFVDVIDEMERKLDEVKYYGKDHITRIEWDDDDVVFDLGLDGAAYRHRIHAVFRKDMQFSEDGNIRMVDDFHAL